MHVSDSYDGLLLHNLELRLVHQSVRCLRLLRLVRLVEEVALLLLQILHSDI